VLAPAPGGVPDFYRMPAAMWWNRQGELVVYAFDLPHRDGRDLRQLPLIERLLARSRVPCLRLVEAFADGERLLEAAERHRLKGVVSRGKASRYLTLPLGPGGGIGAR
jgi:bifunctional non-homologous end joining protein LigD